MQAISKTKHTQLHEAIFQLECILESIDKDSKDLCRAVEYRRELAAMYKNYERMLEELAEQIAAYESLFSDIISNLIARKLKELKKEIHAGQPAFRMLSENIQLAYGT